MKRPIITLALAVGFTSAFACTNYIVTKGASTTGAPIISYAADSHVLYGELYHYPAGLHSAGSMRQIIEWDTYKPLGEIPEAAETYNVVGNINEYGLAIGETTFGGRHELHDSNGKLDYGSLIYLALQRSRTAREAIKTIATLMETYGYYSEGESFSIADTEEAWIMELIGKGSKEVKNAKGKPFARGAVWVAVRIPDGYISGHANQARIQTFPLADGKKSLTFTQMKKKFPAEAEVVYADDVIAFARAMGYFNGADKDFSFSDTYNPVDFGGARACDARVWWWFNEVSIGMGEYLDYAMGHNLKHRMPLYVKPTRKLGVADVAFAMRNHFEGTPMDMRKDLGAGPFGCPYRWRPMNWESQGKKYVNERASATQQTGFWFVADCRVAAPKTGGVIWFGVDDASTSCLTPIFGCSTDTPPCLTVGNGDMTTYSPTSAFWLFNRVTNFAYSRYNDMSADIIKVQQGFENDSYAMVDHLMEQIKSVEPLDLQVKMLTEFSVQRAEKMFNIWKDLDNYLLVKYIDGNVKKEKDGRFEKNENNKACAFPAQPGYPQWWLDEIAKNAGETLKAD